MTDDADAAVSVVPGDRHAPTGAAEPRDHVGHPLQVLVEVVAGDEPIRGQLWRLLAPSGPSKATVPPGGERGHAVPFAGWMGLFAAFDTVLRAAGIATGALADDPTGVTPAGRARPMGEPTVTDPTGGAR
jgi:hypothetical protein